MVPVNVQYSVFEVLDSLICGIVVKDLKVIYHVTNLSQIQGTGKSLAVPWRVKRDK